MQITETNLKFSGALSNRSRTNYIILHHRAGDGDIKSIHNQHLNQGYIGIGYHFYIRKDGSIYRGRPIQTVGAHCLNYNHNSVGICFEGNFEKDNINEKQIKAGTELIEYLKNKYPSAQVMGHRDLMATACPGKNFPLSDIKSEKALNKELTSANDITWELSQMIKINDVDGFVKALDKAKRENSPLYFGLKKIVNGG